VQTLDYLGKKRTSVTAEALTSIQV
jgi:hypothetical protein